MFRSSRPAPPAPPPPGAAAPAPPADAAAPDSKQANEWHGVHEWLRDWLKLDKRAVLQAGSAAQLARLRELQKLEAAIGDSAADDPTFTHEHFPSEEVRKLYARNCLELMARRRTPRTGTPPRPDVSRGRPVDRAATAAAAAHRLVRPSSMSRALPGV